MTRRYPPCMRLPGHLFLAALLAVSARAIATPDDPPSPPPAVKPAAATPPAPKSLDDLLGVPQSGTGEGSADDAAKREQQKRLERSLDEASMEDLVHKAIAGMKDASDRLSDAKDPGLGTQRIQEDVVKTLDRLLEEAQKRQGKKSSSSKKSSSKKDQKQDPSEQNGQQQKQRPQSKPGSTPKSGDNTDAAHDGTREDGVAATQELSESRIEWGQLPERVRELVLQGRRDRVSTIYERLTREYFRRLAEEASR